MYLPSANVTVLKKFSSAHSSLCDGESVIPIDPRFQKCSMEGLLEREGSMLVSIMNSRFDAIRDRSNGAN